MFRNSFVIVYPILSYSMICPAFAKKQTSIIKEKVEKNITVTRNRYCSCGYSFVTYETTRKLNLKRKTRPDSNWKNF